MHTNVFYSLAFILGQEQQDAFISPVRLKKKKVCVGKEKLSEWKNEPVCAVYLFICFHIRPAFHADINLTTLISG